MFVSTICFFCFLFFVIIYLNEIVLGVQLTSLRQVECKYKILEFFSLQENPDNKKVLYQFALLHLQYVGPDPSEVGDASRDLIWGAIGPNPPYKLYNGITTKNINNAYAVMYYDIISNSFIADNVLTPEDFCDNKDPDNYLGMKTICLYELNQIGYKNKVYDVPSPDLVIRDKMEIVKFTYVHVAFRKKTGHHNIHLNISENMNYYVKEYLMDIAARTETKDDMFFPDEFCKTYVP